MSVVRFRPWAPFFYLPPRDAASPRQRGQGASAATPARPSLRQAWTTLKRSEFLLVVVHVVLTALIGMLYAVMLGLLFTASIFVVQTLPRARSRLISHDLA